MNYPKIYDNLISIARLSNTLKNVYYENHHIIPKSLGGSNDISNLVKLEPRQHYIAHLLLYKIYKDKCVNGCDKTPYYKMLRALSAMVQLTAAYGNDGKILRLFKFGSRNYSTWKNELAIANSNHMKDVYKNRSLEEKKNICLKISDTLKEKWKTNVFPWKGKTHSNETILKMKKYKEEHHPQLGSKNSQYGSKCMYNEILKKTTHVKKELIEEYLKNSWKLGAVYDWDLYFYKKENKQIIDVKKKERIEKKKIKEEKKNKKLKELERKNIENKKLYTEMYEEYCKTGFDGVIKKYGYKYSIANFVQQCKKYVNNYVPQNGKKRGIKQKCFNDKLPELHNGSASHL